jgi:hypothetical protein
MKNHLTSPRVRFNFGYHDGAANKRANRQAMWLKCYQGNGSMGSHYDKIYVEGYWQGHEAQAAGQYMESSQAAWSARSSK